MTGISLTRFLTKFVSPALRENDYVRSGVTFAKRQHAAWTLIDFQQAKSDCGESVTFFPQAGVYVPKARPWLSDALQAEIGGKTPGLEESQVVFSINGSSRFNSERVSDPMSIGTWSLSPNDDIAAAGAELTLKLIGQAIPAIDSLAAAGGGGVVKNGWPDLSPIIVGKPYYYSGPSGADASIYGA